MSHFTALNKKVCLQQIQIFLWICPFSNLLGKTKFLIISELLSEIVTFWTKKRSFQWISLKSFKTTGKHSLAVYGSFWEEKQFFLTFVPFYCFEQKGWFTTNSNFPLDLLLYKFVMKNNLSDYFWAFFWENLLFD